MNGIRIYKVTIDHFRGYRYVKEFNLTSERDVIVLSGPNGFGKTSFFDAIEWGFTGNITRYNDPNEEKSQSRFVNYQPEESLAKVIIEFGDSSNKYIVTRMATNSEGKNTDFGEEKTILTLQINDDHLFEGEEAKALLNDIMITDEWRSKIKFEDVFSQYHLLTQDKLKNFVQGIKATERYKKISLLFGTERFLVYSEHFKKLQDTINKNNNELEKQYYAYNSDIEKLKIQISQNNTINLGSYNNLDEYFKSLVDQYTDISSKINLCKYNYDYSLSVAQQTSRVKELIKDEIQIVSKRIFNNNQLIEKLKYIQLEKENYKTLKIRRDTISKLIPQMKKLKDYLFVKDNLNDYKNFSETSIDLENKIKKLKSNYEFMWTNVISLRKLYKEVQLFTDNLSSTINDNNIESLSKIMNLMDIIHKLVPTLKIDANDIYYINEDNEAVISFFNQKILVEKNIETQNSLDTLDKIFKQGNKQIMNILINYKNLIKELDGGKYEINKGLEVINKDIEKLNSLELDIMDILNNALNYIKKDVSQSSKGVKCPVCGTGFEGTILIGRIEDKIKQGNPVLQTKIHERSRLQSYQKLMFEKQDTYIEALSKDLRKYFQDTLIYQEYIGTIGKKVRMAADKLSLEIEKLSEELSILKTKYKNMQLKINSLNLAEDIDILDVKLQENIDTVTSVIRELGFDYIDVSIEEQEKIYSKLINNISVFEDNVKALGIDIVKIDESLKCKIGEQEIELQILSSALSDLKCIESNIQMIYIGFENEKKSKKLEEMVIKAKKLDNDIKNNNRIAGKIADIQEAIKSTIEELNQNIVNQSQDLINTIFNKIYAHPNFRNLELEINLNRRDNNVLYLKCSNGNDEVNPVFIFSSAQINAVALSIFLALALEQRCTRLENVFLDDPIQNMDDINVLAFVDIIRSVITSSKFSKKFVLSTHDEQFYRLMSKKFRFLNTRIFRFADYNNNGPTFTTKDTKNDYSKINLIYKKLEEKLEDDRLK